MKTVVIRLLIVLAISGSFTSCKKAIEKAKEEAIMNAMTDGVWYVSSFKEGTTDETSSFAGWEFQYFSDGTSVATQTVQVNSVAPVAGTWAGNASNWTFTSAFNTTPPAPLDKLAGTWTVTRAVSTNKGSFSKTEGSITYTMDLTKK